MRKKNKIIKTIIEDEKTTEIFENGAKREKIRNVEIIKRYLKEKEIEEDIKNIESITLINGNFSYYTNKKIKLKLFNSRKQLLEKIGISKYVINTIDLCGSQLKTTADISEIEIEKGSEYLGAYKSFGKDDFGAYMKIKLVYYDYWYLKSLAGPEKTTEKIEKIQEITMVK